MSDIIRHTSYIQFFMKIPENIYHYTTIETLALILKSRKIRFNSLSNLDDLAESNTEDLGNISSFILVSCWTDKEDENISLWNMYCKNGNGIRLKMQPTIFQHELTEELEYFFTPENEKRLWLPSNSLTEIQYIDEISKNFRPKEIGTIDLRKLGKEKHKIWQFQNEWRFLIYQFLDNENLHKVMKLDLLEAKEALKKYEFEYDYYDYKIRDVEFENMEIMLGPSTTVAEEIIVDALIAKYNPLAKIKKSNLTKTIRLK
nr:DUF2971 domain-containing protein [uncultured Flavobacterium sp.]